MKKVAELTISHGFNLKAYPKLTFDFFSRESDSTIANVCSSVRLSVSHQNPSASQNHAYQPNLPISHNATMPPPPLSLSES